MGLSHGFAAAIAITAVAISPAAAADLELHPVYGRHFEVTSLPTWHAEIGARYWASTGTTKKELSSPGGDFLVSRLTYNNLLAHAGELFGRFDHFTGVFIKGYIGGGVVTGGQLTDEDWNLPTPPFAFNFSSTNSTQHSGSLAYGTIDFGYAMLNSPTLRLGAFAGYHHYYERVNAYGCTQTIPEQTSICVPAIPDSTLGITETTNWDAVRLGLNAQWRITDRLMLTGDLAWLPVAWLNASDRHWLRFSTATAETGGGVNNVQLELVLSYDVTSAFSVGVGGRYWNITTGSQGSAVDFTAVGGTSQPLSFRTERWGGFLQAAYKFGG